MSESKEGERELGGSDNKDRGQAVEADAIYTEGQAPPAGEHKV